MRAAPVRGNYKAQQALDIALGKSGLNYKVVDQTLITVAGKPAAAAPPLAPSSAITSKPITVVGESVQNPDDPYNTSYNVTNASTFTKSIHRLWNLLDKTYYSGTSAGSMIGVAAPRSFMGSIKLEF